MKRSIPNTLTLINLIAGGSGVVFIYLDYTLLTLICIAIALIADMLDGAVARSLGAQSELGVQLDSLADVISFGLLPSAILAYDVARCEEYAIWMVPLAMIPAAASALRLAKFNLDTRDHSVFYGLPTPASATIIFGLLLMSYTEHPWLEYFTCEPVLFVGLIVLLPLLMLIDLRLWSLKGLGKPRGKAILGILLAIFAILAATTGSAAISLTVLLYVLFGLLNTLIKVY